MTNEFLKTSSYSFCDRVNDTAKEKPVNDGGGSNAPLAGDPVLSDYVEAESVDPPTNQGQE
jgi:hypothetical protein